MHLNPKQKVCFLNIETFKNFVFISSTFILIVVLASKRRHFIMPRYKDTGLEFCWDRVLLGYNNKIHESLLYLKNKLFVQDLNAKVVKVQDFNIDFPFTLFSTYLKFFIIIFYFNLIIHKLYI